MSRRFTYARVSNIAQETETQIAETVSGSVATAKRNGFARLLDKMEQGDVLIVKKLDRLGRDAKDLIPRTQRKAGGNLGRRSLSMIEIIKAKDKGKVMRGERQRSVAKGRTMCRLTKTKMVHPERFERPTP